MNEIILSKCSEKFKKKTTDVHLPPLTHFKVNSHFAGHPRDWRRLMAKIN